MITTNVNIISDYLTAQKFRNMKNFELDLGKRNLNQLGKSTIMKIADRFIEYVFKEYGFMIYKIGNYGSISFYYTNHSEKNVVYIFYDKLENEVKIPSDVVDLEEWLSKELYNLQEKINSMTNGA